MPTDLHQPHVARALRRFPPDGLLRESMELECSSLFNTVLWHRQFAIDRNYAVIDDTSGKERMLNLHIFYDDLVNFSLKNDSIKSFFYRKSSLESILNNATKIESDDLSEYDDEIFDIEYDEKRKLIKIFQHIIMLQPMNTDFLAYTLLQQRLWSNITRQRFWK